MAVIDKINRKGIDGKRVITGPAELVGPKSGDTKSDFARLSGIRGSVDQIASGWLSSARITRR